MPRLPEPDEHAEHGVPEAEPEPREPLVCVRARAQPRLHRAAPLAEAEQRDVGVLVGWLRRGLEEPDRLLELTMGAERSQLRARARGEGGGCRRRDCGRAETASLPRREAVEAGVGEGPRRGKGGEWEEG